MIASYERKLTQSSPELPFKRLRFWDNSRLLAPYGCSEFMFVSGAGPGVRTVTPSLNSPSMLLSLGCSGRNILSLDLSSLVCVVLMRTTNMDHPWDGTGFRNAARCTVCLPWTDIFCSKCQTPQRLADVAIEV